MVALICLLQYFGAGRGEDLRKLQPYSNSVIIGGALILGALVILVFTVLYGRPLRINNDIGQIGDFIGGLVNPILGFLGLLVLLRTSLLQTIELRKTTELMVEQKRLMEIERVDTVFHKFMERYEQRAGKTLRATDGGLLVSAKKLKSLLEGRELVESLSGREKLKKIEKLVEAELDFDDLKMCFDYALRVFNVIYNAQITEPEKEEYYSIFIEFLEPIEAILLLTFAFVYWKKSRKRFRKHLDIGSFKGEFFLSDWIYNYYTGDGAANSD
jgi:hypothetical protein